MSRHLVFVSAIVLLSCGAAVAQTSSSNATYGGTTKDGNKTYVQPQGPTDTTKSPYVKLPDNRPKPVVVNAKPYEPVRVQGSKGETVK